MKVKFAYGAALASLLLSYTTVQAAQSDRIAPPTLRYLANGTQLAEGVVLSGENLTIEYDPIRLSNCRGKNSEGIEDWNVQAYLAIDGGAPLVADLIQGRGTQFPYAIPFNIIIPDGHRLDVWFKASDVQGCVQWDSNNNKNYSYAITRLDDIPEISFNENWQIEQKGLLKAGRPVRIHYDMNRSTACRTGGYHGSASWSIFAHLMIDGKTLQPQALTYSKSWSERGQQDIVVLLPQGRDLAIWFENSGYEYYQGRPCVGYDSNFGANYNFTLN